MNSQYTDHQQQEYNALYGHADTEYGFPDRKIGDGLALRDKLILSVGSGAAVDMRHLVEGNRAVGVDYAIAGLIMGKRHGVEGVLIDLNRSPALPFRDEAFDVVVCKDILEHLLDPLAVLREISRVLTDDGYVVISVPNHFHLTMRLRLLLGKGLIWKSVSADHRRRYREWDYMHIRFFTYGGFRQFLEVGGFRPQRWFWDFGDMAHYGNPDMYLEPQLWKRAQGMPISRRGRVGLRVIRPLWIALNSLFRRSWRSAIVSLAPGLLCSGFYVRCVKAESRKPGYRVGMPTYR